VLDAVGGAMVFGAAMVIAPALQEVVARLNQPAPVMATSTTE
jgi:hypothetical protein